MSINDTIGGLNAFAGRGAGTNAERRTALWLAGELRTGRREATLEPFWSRPNWAAANAWHAALAAVGSLLAVASPKLGGALIIVALVSVLSDALIGLSPGRRVTRERASQNVVSPAPAGAPPIRLILTANYDAGRMGLVHQPVLRRAAARVRVLLGPLALGWQGILIIGCLWVLAVAVARDGGATGPAIGVVQLIPTAGLVLTAALLLELGSSSFGPAAGDNGTGTALAVALARALDVAPPRHLAVDVVLQGASDGSMIGLRRYLRARRHELDAASVIVIGLAASGGGHPTWWRSDGPLLPLRFLPRLTQLAEGVTAGVSAAHRGRGSSPAYPARVRGLPALTIGALDGLGLCPRSHLPVDTAPQVDPAVTDRMLELALTLVDAIDAAVPAVPAASRSEANLGPSAGGG